jgi:hypothetical protein
MQFGIDLENRSIAYRKSTGVGKEHRISSDVDSVLDLDRWCR